MENPLSQSSTSKELRPTQRGGVKEGADVVRTAPRTFLATKHRENWTRLGQIATVRTASRLY